MIVQDSLCFTVMILIVPVVFFTYLEGYIGGAMSGVIAVAYSAFFSCPDTG